MTAKRMSTRFSSSLSRLSAAILAAMLLTAPSGPGATAAGQDNAADEQDESAQRIQVARLTWGDDDDHEQGDAPARVCFSSGFLTTVARETDTPVHRQLVEVAIDDEAIFDYPFVVLTGVGSMSLTQRERDNLSAYIERGGFLLASPSCSDADWGRSFTTLMQEMFESNPSLTRIEPGHGVFHSLYDIPRVQSRRPGVDAALYGLDFEGTLRVVFAPSGVNDTDHAGGGCCCCGGNEAPNARLIKANLLVYALTH